MKGVSSQEKVELKELMNWANEKIGLKLEKARQEGKSSECYTFKHKNK